MNIECPFYFAKIKEEQLVHVHFGHAEAFQSF